ncbi:MULTISPECIES: hypothetical protein [unclassified Vibrio]|uniref:hypothetical protein n=2 Tax=Vibrio TaxID=662 RepID=UPI0013617DFC|nr:MULTISPECIES: hypothetical protein [unclassified Vibrio]NAW60002.1 hypothetical protein [Vibrio sp. V36_P2S2PM302]NAX24832.1 hypothetical protein [Vibrio sp. V38_P2S17PM301]
MKRPRRFIKQLFFIGLLSVLGAPYVQIHASTITFSGSVIEPGCMLQQEGIRCYEPAIKDYQLTYLPFKDISAKMSVGEKVYISSPSLKINWVEVHRLSEKSVIVSANFL